MNKLQCIDLSIQKKEKFETLERIDYIRDKWEIDETTHFVLIADSIEEYRKTVNDILNNK